MNDSSRDVITPTVLQTSYSYPHPIYLDPEYQPTRHIYAFTAHVAHHLASLSIENHSFARKVRSSATDGFQMRESARRISLMEQGKKLLREQRCYPKLCVRVGVDRLETPPPATVEMKWEDITIGSNGSIIWRHME